MKNKNRWGAKMDASIFQEMLAKWPSAVVARTEIAVFSGGMIKEKYAANLDSAGLGCPGRFRVGRKICYSAKKLAEWLESRSTAIPEKVRQTE
jgi:hypothetical protein